MAYISIIFRNILFLVSFLFLSVIFAHPAHSKQNDLTFFDDQIKQHKNKSGIFVLEKGEQALLARAWLADHAQKSIEVQYFIWSTDNIGILAAESLLRAAQRGVKVKIIVDDLLIDAPDKYLLALALHPNIQIKIYNPKHSVGTSFLKRVINAVTDFRGVNQRMHDKTFIVDGKVAITGGRNMADEYFDYDQQYNFRDRDALVIGPVVNEMQSSFKLFWEYELSATVEKRFSGEELLQNKVTVADKEIQLIYKELHEYAASPENFEEEVRTAISALSTAFKTLTKNIVWSEVQFISDKPGKNNNRFSLGGGGQSTSALAKLVEKAQKTILIQSPYLVLSDEAGELFRAALQRGVEIKVSTNSLASTDNLQAFSGYKNQREKLLAAGMKIFEYKPFPEIHHQLLERYPRLKKNKPVFAIHAKTMIVDSEILYIGTYNFDPRSENLNTEVGIIVTNVKLATVVEKAIERDIAKENSWNAKNDPDQYASFGKRLKVFFWQLLPLRPIL
ncbi:MAG: phospholipase D family protein [Thiohalomonadales bacterium]